MTATTIRVQMVQRKDTAANWTAANPILLSGEIGYETDTKKFKIGNGSSNWNTLTYLPIPDGSGNLTITGNLEIGTTGSLTFEGSTANAFETTLAVTDPTADRTITFPDRSGTVVTSVNDIINVGTWEATTIATSYGGTGQTTYTNGQLLIGNTTGNTLTKATLTAGTGIAITNGGGSITLAINSTAAIGDLTTTATTGTLPTANGSVTIADAAAPTNAELLEYCVELEAKLEAALAALRTTGVIAT